jgi:hypothetical protein
MPGSYSHTESLFFDFNVLWPNYGNIPIETTYFSGDINYAEIKATNADILVFSHAAFKFYTAGEISAVKSYLKEGHAVYGSMGILDSMVTHSMFGLEEANYEGWMPYQNSYMVWEPEAENISNNVSNPYASIGGSSSSMHPPGGGPWTLSNLTDGEFVALSETQMVAYVWKDTDYLSFYCSNFPEQSGYYGNRTDDRQFCYNVLLWLYGVFGPPSSFPIPTLQYGYDHQPIEINASAYDYDGVSNVTLWYRFSPNNLTWNSFRNFDISLSEPWNWSFDFPLGEGYYEFYTIANNTKNETESPPEFTDLACVYDVSPPNISDESSKTGTTGDTFEFQAIVTDNLHLSRVSVVYSFGSGIETNIKMTQISSKRYLSIINISDSSNETLHYKIEAVDEVGNMYVHDTKDVPIYDNDNPEANAGSNQTVILGTEVVFSGSGSKDNIGISNFTWVFYDGIENVTLYGKQPSYNFTIQGTYEVVLTVYDFKLNSDQDSVIINVEPLKKNNEDTGGFGYQEYFWIILVIGIIILFAVFLIFAK